MHGPCLLDRIQLTVRSCCFRAGLTADNPDVGVGAFELYVASFFWGVLIITGSES